MVKNTIFDILSNDERIIVYSNFVDNVIVTWNQSLTIQFWRGDNFEEIEIITLPEVPKSFIDCRQKVIQLYNTSFSSDRLAG